MDIFAISNNKANDKSVKRKKTNDRGFSKLLKEKEEKVDNENGNKAIEATFNNPFIISQQTVGNYREAQHQLQKIGGEILKHLNNIRIGLLNGELTRNNILCLAEALDQAKLELKYPELEETINDLKLRAAVEIAKFDSNT